MKKKILVPIMALAMIVAAGVNYEGYSKKSLPSISISLTQIHSAFAQTTGETNQEYGYFKFSGNCYAKNGEKCGTQTICSWAKGGPNSSCTSASCPC